MYDQYFTALVTVMKRNTLETQRKKKYIFSEKQN